MKFSTTALVVSTALPHVFADQQTYLSRRAEALSRSSLITVTDDCHGRVFNVDVVPHDTTFNATKVEMPALGLPCDWDPSENVHVVLSTSMVPSTAELLPSGQLIFFDSTAKGVFAWAWELEDLPIGDGIESDPYSTVTPRLQFSNVTMHSLLDDTGDFSQANHTWYIENNILRPETRFWEDFIMCSVDGVDYLLWRTSSSTTELPPTGCTTVDLVARNQKHVILNSGAPTMSVRTGSVVVGALAFIMAALMM